MQKRKKTIHLTKQVAIVGGGMSGICAALASARAGCETILVHDRSVLGGNASSEIRMHICGAAVDMTKQNMEETGILYELMLENKKCNDSYNYSIWSTVLWNAVRSQKHLQTLLNCVMVGMDLDGKSVGTITCYQSTTETEFIIDAQQFVDASGNGTLSYFAGAEFVTGSESIEEFHEPHAPEQANNYRMGNTLLFKAVDTGKPVKFSPPSWAWHFSEKDLRFRNHIPLNVHDVKTLLDQGEGEEGRRYTEAPCIDYGYWWIELCGEKDIINEYETIRDDLLCAVYGVWDHIKNGGDHGAENYDLAWVGMVPGVRESRRFLGDYRLTENDVLENRRFPDAVAYGGWPIDVHCPHGLLDMDQVPSFVYSFPGVYTIPYRCYYSKDIENLSYAGRIISATKLAMASSRIMGTCAIGGQAVGSAVALCIRYGCSPRDVETMHMDELQQLLLKDDCYIPGIKNHDAHDIAREGSVSASPGSVGASLLLSGVSRPEGKESNCWVSAPLSEETAWFSVRLKQEQMISSVRLTFVTDLSRPIKITMSSRRQAMQQIGVPEDLVKDYVVTLLLHGKIVMEKTVQGNYQRLYVCSFPRMCCDEVKVTCLSTNGSNRAKVFECRIYDDADEN